MFGQELLMVGWAPGGHICSANAIFLNNRAIRDPMGCGTKRPAMYQCVTHLVLLPINSGLKVAHFSSCAQKIVGSQSVERGNVQRLNPDNLLVPVPWALKRP